MMDDTFKLLVILLVLIVLGLISFHYYAYVTTDNNLSFGTGLGVTLLPKEQFGTSAGDIVMIVFFSIFGLMFLGFLFVIVKMLYERFFKKKTTYETIQ